MRGVEIVAKFGLSIDTVNKIVTGRSHFNDTLAVRREIQREKNK